MLQAADVDDRIEDLGVLSDGRVVSLAAHGITAWDPTRPGAAGQSLCDLKGDVITVLPDDRIVTGYGSGGVHLWTRTPRNRQRCSVTQATCAQ